MRETAKLILQMDGWIVHVMSMCLGKSHSFSKDKLDGDELDLSQHVGQKGLSYVA